MGYLCYLFLALTGGAIGGLIFSLTTGDSHKLRLPFIRKGKPTEFMETGFVGHMLIGAFAGLLLLSLVISQINFDVTPAVGLDAKPFSSVSVLGKAGLIVVIHTLSITTIGGFLGLRLIVKLAEEAFAALNKKLKNMAVETDVFRLAFLARQLMQEGYLDQALVEVEKSLSIRPTKFAELTKSLILRRKDDFPGALSALDRALKIEPDVLSVDDAAILWNKACYLSLSAGETAIKQIIENLDKSLAVKPDYRADIVKEKDFAPIIDNKTFRAHYSLTQLTKETSP